MARTRLTLLGLGLTGLLAAGAQAQTLMSVDVHGGGSYPSSTPDSIGNESGIGDAKSVPQTATTSLGRSVTGSGSGVDGNGIAGSASFSAAATGSVGTLHSGVSVQATADTRSAGGFPHGAASGFAAISFWSTVRLYDSAFALGAPMPVTLSLDLDWTGTLDLTADFARGTVVSFAEAKIGSILDVTEHHIHDSSVGDTDETSGPATAFVINGDTVDIFGQLQTSAQTSLYNAGAVLAHGAADSDASNTLHIYLSGSPTLTAIAEDGTSLTQDVPEPASAALLLAGIAGLARRRR